MSHEYRQTSRRHPLEVFFGWRPADVHRSYFVVSPMGPLNYLSLGFYSAVSVAFAILMCREIFTLEAKRTPRWIGLACAVTLAFAVLALLVLHDQERFVWNHLYLEIPLAIFFALTGLCAWISESRHCIRIYSDFDSRLNNRNKLGLLLCPLLSGC